MLPIYVPTYRRVDVQHTWANLSDEARARTVLVVHEDEQRALAQRGYPTLVCPVQGTGMGAVRQWILDHHSVVEQGPHLVMADDDLGFATRRRDDPTKFLRTEGGPAAFRGMFAALQLGLQYSPLVGLRNRSGANTNPDPLYLPHGRIYGLMAYHVPTLRAEQVRCDRHLIDDFDVLLQLLTRGHRTLMVNRYVKDDVGGSNAAGGMSRNWEKHAKASRALAEQWPDYVKVVEKGAWPGMTQPRLDVQIQWQKAYRAGVADRELLGRPQEPDFPLL